MTTEQSASAPVAHQASVLLGLSYCNFMGYLGLTLAPMWVVAVAAASSGSVGAAGMVASLEFAGFGIASLVTAGLITRFEPRRLALVGLILATVGDGGSYWAHDFVSISICRIASGIGEGVLLAAVNAAAVGTPNPQRSFAVMSFVLVGLGALCFVATPIAKDAMGSSGVFAIMAALRIPGIAVLPLLPRKGAAGGADLARPRFSPRVLRLLLAYALFMTGQLSVYTFLEPIGTAQGLSLRAITFVLALGGFVTLLGPLSAGWLGTRYGRRRPLVIGLCATGLSALLFLLPGNVLAFTSGDIFFNLIAQFSIVYFLGLLATLDPTGRSVAASSAFMSLGITVGPLVGGLSIRYLGLSSVSLAAVALHLLAAAIVANPLGRIGTTPEIEGVPGG